MRTKLVNGVSVDLTPAEVAEITADEAKQAVKRVGTQAAADVKTKFSKAKDAYLEKKMLSEAGGGGALQEILDWKVARDANT